ncbi:MAG: hypothetical protein IID60_06715, partial [Proteobacteria bacterium]|nr:hypothetical protein [Pseudomonadota bacterium]
MKTSHLHLLLISTFFLSACEREQDVPEPETMAVEAEISLQNAAPVTDTDRMMSNIAELSSDRYGGREPMSEGERLTLNFIENRFRDMGLEPLFGDSYLQPVELVSIEADPALAQMTFHMNGKDRLVKYGDEMVIGTMRVVPE